MTVADKLLRDRATNRLAARAERASSAPALTTFMANILPSPNSNNDNRYPWHEAGPATELDCLRSSFPPHLLKTAAIRSSEVGVGADQVLIQSCAIDEEAYLQQLADYTGLAIEDFSGLTRADCPLSDAEIYAAAKHGLLPLRRQGQPIFVYAPSGYGARRISDLMKRYRSLSPRIRLTSRRALNQFLTQQAGHALAHVACEGLRERFPELSAVPAPVYRSPFQAIMRYCLRLICPVAMLTLAPLMVMEVCGVILASWFMVFNGLRLAGSIVPRRQKGQLPPLHNEQLPVYTVIAALYREAASVEPLMQYINALDYPREKLDVKIVIEPDDLETRAAIARLGPMPHVQVIIAPSAGPRTKPKALNFALAFARGSFTTVFDAEDRPDPDQLRAALDAFRTHSPDVACVQACLCIDNANDSLLAQMFTAEYAGQFDVFLQGFSEFGLPLPLGGSSNHFRTEVLREVGGWDPYNVTEDADLGFRLARFKYRSVMFRATTYEEAPAKFGAWLRQRSRWMKGWMQTWQVHMRSPRQLWRDIGMRGFFTLNIIVGGNVLTALTFLLVLLIILVQLAMYAMTNKTISFLTIPFIEFHITAFAIGYFSTVLIGTVGLARRGYLHKAWILPFAPIYWVCLSIAAWRGLYQLVTEPYRWEKTEHGLAHKRMTAQQMASSGKPAPRFARTWARHKTFKTRYSV